MAHTKSNDKSASTLAAQTNKIVQKSTLPKARINKITSSVNKYDADFVAGQNNNGATAVGALTLTFPDGRTVQINIGTGAVLDSQGNVVSRGTLTELAKTNPELKAALKEAVELYADKVAKGEVPADEGSVKLAALVQVASQANPAGAAEYVGIATRAVLANTDLKTEGTLAISTIVAAATNGNSPVNVQSVIDSASQTATESNVTFNKTTFEAQREEANETLAESKSVTVEIDLDARDPSANR